MDCSPKLALTGAVLLILVFSSSVSRAGGVIIDHRHTDLAALPPAAVDKAKAELHIAYGHTSHGSQVTDGMTGLNTFINGGGLGLSYPQNTFAWNNGGSGGALDLHDRFKSGDLGNPDRTTWAARTRDYLDEAANSDVNVIIWSWCGQADTSEANINLYLDTMSQLEVDYPQVSFVYMTGHVNGCSTTGNLFYRNQQIRDHCLANNGILYDFADIESYDPGGSYYGDKLVTDDCYYDSDDNGSRDRNWAIDWQNSHTEGVDWYNCNCAHSRPLNGNQKAYAAWALWTQIAAMRNPLPGDATLDGRVTDADAAVLGSHWQQSPAVWTDGDFNGDGCVTDADAAILATHWQEGVTETAPIPEPSTPIALLSMAALGLLIYTPNSWGGLEFACFSAACRYSKGCAVCRVNIRRTHTRQTVDSRVRPRRTTSRVRFSKTVRRGASRTHPT